MVYLSADSQPSKQEPLDSNPTGSRTHDLFITSPTFYSYTRYATKPPTSRGLLYIVKSANN